MIQMEFTIPKIAEKIKARQEEIMRSVLSAMQFNRAMMFDTEGSYNGRKGWDKSKRAERQGGLTLSDTGTLRRSLVGDKQGNSDANGATNIGKDVVTLTTHVHYAKYMNYGTKYVKARNFSDFNEMDRKEFSDTLKNKLIAVISGDE